MLPTDCVNYKHINTLYNFAPDATTQMCRISRCILVQIKSDVNLPEARGLLHIRLLTRMKIDGAKLLVRFWEVSVKT